MNWLLHLYDLVMPWWIFGCIAFFLIWVAADLGAFLDRVIEGRSAFTDNAVQFTERKKDERDERVPDPVEDFWGGVREINRQRGGMNSWGRKK